MDADDMRTILKEGTRVRLVAPTWGLYLSSDLGTVTSDEGEGGYYTVHLDEPALYDHGLGSIETLNDILEAADNMEVVG